MAEEGKTSLVILGIVAIVAIFGFVMLFDMSDAGLTGAAVGSYGEARSWFRTLGGPMASEQAAFMEIELDITHRRIAPYRPYWGPYCADKSLDFVIGWNLGYADEMTQQEAMDVTESFVHEIYLDGKPLSEFAKVERTPVRKVKTIGGDTYLFFEGASFKSGTLTVGTHTSRVVVYLEGEKYADWFDTFEVISC